MGWLPYVSGYSTTVFIHMRGTNWDFAGFFFLLISFFRLYLEGVFFVDGKEEGGLRAEKRVGISGSFSCVCVKERGLIEWGGVCFLGIFMVVGAGEKSCFVM